jgi:hypothetical protein
LRRDAHPRTHIYEYTARAHRCEEHAHKADGMNVYELRCDADDERPRTDARARRTDSHTRHTSETAIDTIGICPLEAN